MGLKVGERREDMPNRRRCLGSKWVLKFADMLLVSLVSKFQSIKPCVRAEYSPFILFFSSLASAKRAFGVEMAALTTASGGRGVIE